MRVLNATQFKGAPDFGEKLPVVYEQFIFDGVTHANTGTQLNTDNLKARMAGNALVCLDVETHGSPQELKGLTRWADTYGDAPFGYFGSALEIHDPRILVSGSSQQIAWMALFDQYANILRNTDALFPSLYTWIADPIAWADSAVLMIEQYRRVAPNLPVYPFVWMESPLDGQEGWSVGDAMWHLQIKTLSRLCDGVVVWGGYRKIAGSWVQQPWDINNKWLPILNAINM
jgi:hypothetical protein